MGYRWVGWTLFCLCVTSFTSMHATAAEYLVIPSLELRETYNDNVYFKNEEDFEHHASPGLEFVARRDTAELKTTCAWNLSKYSRHDEFDTVEQTYGLDTRAFLNPLLEVGFSGQYLDDYTFRDTLEESGDLAKRSQRKRVRVGPRTAVRVGERNTLQCLYDFEKTLYGYKGYDDYWLQGANLIWVHDLGAKLPSLMFVAGGHMIDFDRDRGDLRQYTYRGLFGVEHRPTETVSMTFKAGVRNTKSELQEAGTVSRDRDTGFLFDGSVRWNAERTTISVHANSDVAPSIYGEVIKRQRFSTTLRYRFTERLSGRVRGAYYHSETEGISEKEERRTFSIWPSMTYRLSEKMDLTLAYTHTSTENQMTNNSDEQNRVYAALSMTWPQQY